MKQLLILGCISFSLVMTGCATSEHDDLKDEFSENSEAEAEEPDGSEDEYDNIDISEYVSDGDDEIADYKLRDENYPADDENKVIPIKSQISFYDLLRNQLGLLNLDARQYKVAEQIVGSIDEDGYLRRDNQSIVDDLAFRQNIVSSEAEIKALIKQIQSFDPPGICAKDLKECLIIQLQRKLGEGKEVVIAMQVMEKYFHPGSGMLCKTFCAVQHIFQDGVLIVLHLPVKHQVPGKNEQHGGCHVW